MKTYLFSFSLLGAAIIMIVCISLTFAFAEGENQAENRQVKKTIDDLAEEKIAECGRCSRTRAATRTDEIMRIRCWLDCLADYAKQENEKLYSYGIAFKIDNFLNKDEKDFKDNVEGFTRMREMNNCLFQLFGEIGGKKDKRKRSRDEITLSVFKTAINIDKLVIDLSDLLLLLKLDNITHLCERDILQEKISTTPGLKHLLKDGELEDNMYDHFCGNISSRLTNEDKINLTNPRRSLIKKILRKKEPSKKSLIFKLVACNKVYGFCLYGAKRTPIKQKKECQKYIGRRNSPRSEDWYQGCIAGIDRHLSDYKGDERKYYSTTAGFGVYYGNSSYRYLNDHFSDNGKGMVCSTAGIKIIDTYEKESTIGRINVNVLRKAGIYLPPQTHGNKTINPLNYNYFYAPDLFEIASQGYIIEFGSISGHAFVSKYAIPKRNCRYANITDFKTCESFYERQEREYGLIPNLHKKGLLRFLLSGNGNRDMQNRMLTYFASKINGCGFADRLKAKVNSSPDLKRYFLSKPLLKQYITEPAVK